MTDLRKAAEAALEVLDCLPWHASPIALEATKALRQALAQPEQYDQTALELCEKCGWKAIIPDEGCLVCARNEHEPYVYVGSEHKGYREVFPLYRAPPKREWVGLSNVDKVNIRGMWVLHGRFEDCLEATEAKLKEKNHGRI
jgi:hypothetical protein